jgi:hypothetical protein
MLACRSRNVLNLSLCLVLSASLSGLPSLAEGPGSDLAALEGRIIASEAATPVAGVVLQATRPGSEAVFRSEATDEAGRFALRDLPAGTYDLAVETPQGVYQSPATVTLAPGQSEQVLLGLAPAKNEDPEDSPAVVDEEEDERRPGMTVIKNPLVMTLISLGGLTLLAWGIDSTVDRNEDSGNESGASPSAP